MTSKAFGRFPTRHTCVIPDMLTSTTSLFINDDDEIRMIDNPDNYFKFHITKNDRWNARHGFSFHGTGLPN